MIATGSGDNTARTWDAATGAALATLRGHAGQVEAVSFAPDGSLLATASDRQDGPHLGPAERGARPHAQRARIVGVRRRVLPAR